MKQNIQELTPNVMHFFAEMVARLVPGLKVTLIIADEESTAVRITSKIPQYQLADILRELAASMDGKPPVRMEGSNHDNFELECRMKTTFMATGQMSSIDNVKVMFPFPQYVKPELIGTSRELTKHGAKIGSMLIVNGLSAHIHYAHQSKLWDSADHLRTIIAQLEERFVAVAEFSKNPKWEESKNG